MSNNLEWHKTPNQILADRGLNSSGKVQMLIDSEVIRRMKPYTPMLSGTMIKSATVSTKIGSGEIKEDTPYSRYQYYGKLMVSSVTGSSYANIGEKKVLTNKNLSYRKINPNAGPFWFERMKSDHKKAILEMAKNTSGAE